MQVRVYELGQLGMKFERHLDSEVVDFQILSDDYAKVNPFHYSSTSSMMSMGHHLLLRESLVPHF